VAFNEEIVARAIFASEIPVISGVGHETDFTIADFVADVRASTPSAAAELVVQTRAQFDKHIADLRETLAGVFRYRLLEWSRRVHELSARRGFRRPLDLLRQQRQRADEMTSRLALGLRARLEQSRKRFTAAHLRIASFDFRVKSVCSACASKDVPPNSASASSAFCARNAIAGSASPCNSRNAGH